jgi:hypothetical protein
MLHWVYFSILLYWGNKVSGLNLIQIQFFINNWRPSSGWIWNTLPSYFAHTWWTRAQCLVSLTKLQWDRLAWGSLVPPPSWHVYYWLHCWNNFASWQCICKSPENEHNLNCENEHYLFWSWEINESPRYSHSLYQKICNIKLFNEVYWQMLQKYIGL